MKNLLTILCIIFSSYGLYAQIHCGYQISEERYRALKDWHLKNAIEKGKIAKSSDVEVPVTLWVLNNTPYLHLINTQDFISEMNGVKTVFSEFGIDLDLWENDVRQTYLPSATNYEYSDDYQNISNNYFKENTLNIYVVNTISAGGKSFEGILAGPNIDPQNPNPKDLLVIARNHVNNYTLSHEIGHYFGLLHTWGSGSYKYGQNSVTNEKVNGTNCDTSGDLICDTPADPGNGSSNLECGYYRCSDKFTHSCHYEPGSYYTKRYNPIPDNYMTYNNKYKNCSRSFTIDQKNTMKLFAAQFRDVGNPTFDCEADYYEPNSVFLPNNSAFSYVLESNQNYSILANTNNSSDSDFYRFRVRGSGTINIKLTGMGYPCNLYLYGSSGFIDEGYIGSSELIGVSPEEINYTNTSNSLQTYYVLVQPIGTNEVSCSNNTYTLEVGVKNNNGCNDTYEPNDIKAQGQPLNVNYLGLTSTKTSYISSPTDVDYFKTVIGKPGTYRFSLSNLSGDYDMYITKNSNNQGWENIRFGSQSEIIEIEHQFNSNDTYYIKVVGSGGYYSCDNTYTIGVIALSDDSDNCNDVYYEPNNTIASAQTPFNPVYTAPSNQYVEALVSSSSDIDWYKLGVNGRGNLHIQLENLPADYDIKIYQNNSSSLIGQGQKPGLTTENVFISKTWADSDVYYIRVEGYNGIFDCQDKYRLNINWSPNVNECQGDQYEGVQNTYILPLDDIGSGQQQKTSYATIHNSNDYDYFQIQLNGPGRLEANLSSLPQNYNLDLGHFNNGNYTYIDYSTRSGTSNEFVEYVKTSNYSEPVYVGVKSPLGVYDCDDTYKLYIRWIPDSNGGGNNNCSDNDNTLQTANNLFSTFSTNRSETHYAFIGSPTDVDYYEINSNGPGELNINLSSLPSNYDFDFVLSNGSVLLSSKNYGTANENKYVVYNTLGAGRVYVRVYPAFSTYSCTDSYKITATWTSTAQAACSNQGSYEPNETTTTAKSLWSPFSDSYRYEDISSIINSPTDIDYYRINLSQSGRIELSLHDLPYNNNPKNYDLYLYNAQGIELKRGTKSGNAGEWFTYTSTGSETLYVKVVGVNGQYDCNDDYNLQVIWYPSNNNTSDGGFDPCENVISLDWGNYFYGNISSGTKIINNNYCESGLLGKEIVFSFVFEDGDRYLYGIDLVHDSNSDLNVYILDSCDPNSFCFGKGEEWNIGEKFLGFPSGLEAGKTYYILLDGNSLNSNFSIILTSGYVTIYSYPTPTNISYQCYGLGYNVVFEFEDDITSFSAPGYSWEHLGNNKYKVNSVSNEDVDIEYITSEGPASYTIPAYDCNVYVENCFGLEPPAVPSLAVSCPEEGIPSAEIYNPSGYEVLWYEKEDDQNPIHFGDEFTPDEYGVYYVQYSNPSLGCESSKIAVEFSQEEELEVTPIIVHNQCFADNSGEIDLIIDRDVTNYQFDWSTGDSGVTSLNSLVAGEYSVTITTGYGCEAELIFKINEPSLIQQKTNNDYVQNQECESDVLALIGEQKRIQDLKIGDIVEVKFHTRNFSNIASGGGTIAWNHEQLKFLEISSPYESPFELTFNSSNALSSGWINFIWIGIPPLINDESEFVTLKFEVAKDFDFSEIYLNSSQLEIQWVDDLGNELDFCYEPMVIISAVEQEDFHLCDGESILLKPELEGGAPPYKFVWSTGDTTASIAVEEEGYYEVEVIDDNFCSSVFDFYITRSQFEEINFIHEFYNEQNYITVLNYNSDDQGQWNTGQTDNQITIDNHGWYWYQIKDVNGCTFRDSIEIILFEPMEVEAKVENDFCQNSNGKITVDAINGIAPLFYSFQDQPYSENYEFTDLSAGEYDIKIRDSNGNIDTLNVLVVNEIDALMGFLSYENSQISIELNYQFPPYTILWNGVQTDSLSYTPTENGTYIVELIDNNGCTFTDSVTFTTYFLDSDSDGFGDSSSAIFDCKQPNGYVANDLDCDDQNSNINPNATEVCDGLDNNCNSQIDDGITFTTYFLDSDDDGFGNPSSAISDCKQPNGYVANDLDCDDSNPLINPNATEVCDGLDNNCNSQIDDGITFTTYFLDSDSDGFGNSSSAISDCKQPNGYVANDLDCDDQNPNINPDAEEVPNNEIDEDCDGMDLVSSTYEIGNSAINIFPNPTINEINIEITGNLLFEANLFDLNGKLLLSKENLNKIKVNTLPAGTYLLEIKDQKTGQKIVEKIIIGK